MAWYNLKLANIIAGTAGWYWYKAYAEAWETEHHVHNFDICMGLANTPNGEIHRADRIGPSVQPFTLTSGDNAYGTWVQVLGSGDTPVISGMVKTDANAILVTAADSTATHNIQFAVGESADLAALISANTYTDAPYTAPTGAVDAGKLTILTKRINVTTKVWARSICIGVDAKDISFYVLMHEYTAIPSAL